MTNNNRKRTPLKDHKNDRHAKLLKEQREKLSKARALLYANRRNKNAEDSENSLLDSESEIELFEYQSSDGYNSDDSDKGLKPTMSVFEGLDDLVFTFRSMSVVPSASTPHELCAQVEVRPHSTVLLENMASADKSSSLPGTPFESEPGRSASANSYKFFKSKSAKPSPSRALTNTPTTPR